MMETSSGVAIEIKNVHKVFDSSIEALHDLSLSVAPGEFLTILGPSGCGKSTLLRIIAGLEKPSHGEVRLKGEESLAYVFQDAHLLPWRNVTRNIALPLELRGQSFHSTHGRIAAILSEVELQGTGELFPNQLSGGMKMRVSLARALVTSPKLLLLDEPFGALDEIVRHHLGQLLRRLWRQHQMTVVFVTHSISEATYLSERVVVLTKRPGRAVLDHKVNLPPERSPDLRATVEFAKEVRALYGTMEAQEA